MKRRNTGIDLLRIIAMYFIIVGHILDHGGILSVLLTKEARSVGLISSIIARPAVDCYALITGWGGYKEDNPKLRLTNRTRYKRYFRYWLQVVSIGVGLIIFQSTISGAFDGKRIIKYLLPVTHKAYWYFSAYTITFFVSPFLNEFVKRQNKIAESFFIAFIIMFGFFAETFPNGTLFAKAFRVVWIVALYCIGCIIKKTERNENNHTLIRLIVACFVTAVLGALFLDPLICSILPSYNSWFSGFFSPVILIIGILTVSLFSTSNSILLHSKEKLIEMVSMATFGIYIIHENDAFREWFINDHFRWLGDLNWVFLFPSILLFAGLVFLLSMMIEYSRINVVSKIRNCQKTHKR